jgi:hypothetical protein
MKANTAGLALFDAIASLSSNLVSLHLLMHLSSESRKR